MLYYTRYCLFTLSLLSATQVFAITENCEKDGEFVFTQECISQTLNQQTDSTHPPKADSKAAPRVLDNKPLIPTPKDSLIEKITNAPTRPVSAPNIDRITTETKTSINREERNNLNTANNNIVDCLPRDFFKALEANQLASMECPLTDTLINEQDSRAERKGRTALHWAVLTNNPNLIKTLISKGADLSIRSDTDRHSTPLQLAIMQQDIISAELLAKTGSAINAKNIFGETALHLAVKEQSLELVELLLSTNADIEAKDRTNKTPLLMASLYPNTDIIQLLLSTGAKISANSYLGNNPLHYAALISEESTKLLMDTGVDIDRRNRKGQTPEEKLVSQYLPQHKSTLALLQNQASPQDQTALLFESVKQNDLKTFKALLGQQVSPAGLTISDLYNRPLFIEALRAEGWLQQN